jgi:hypothetical protein
VFLSILASLSFKKLKAPGWSNLKSPTLICSILPPLYYPFRLLSVLRCLVFATFTYLPLYFAINNIDVCYQMKVFILQLCPISFEFSPGSGISVTIVGGILLG